MAYLRAALCVGCACLVAACAGAGPDPENPPRRLSDWGILHKDGDALKLADGTFAYSLRTPLFSDYAEKLRTVSMPAGTRAVMNGDAVFEFPLGTVISKTFFYWIEDGQRIGRETPFMADGIKVLNTESARLVETRLLTRAESGWVAMPYVWNDAQDEAYLKITGDLARFDLRAPDGHMQSANYLIPSRNQCASCHARRNSGGIHPIGPKAWNVNLDVWHASGWLVSDGGARLKRDVSYARRYLDVNCAHCHSDEGAGDTSGLFLDVHETDPTRLGVCKRTIAAGQGTGGHTYDIVPGDPRTSILIHRMRTDNPAEMMPELGRSLVHSAGVSLIADWIHTMPGECSSA